MTTNLPWRTLCHQSDLVPQSGVCALLTDEHGVQQQQIALFQLSQNQVYAIENWDPIGQANVLSRGLLGDLQGELFVASPLFKHRFSLLNGRCLDDQAHQISHYATRIVDGLVQIQAND
jgi:nitrite reductase (NADH) small subunit